jgi:uncharacterized membrane-anchored protein YhcB (DUF1043 family)
MASSLKAVIGVGAALVVGFVVGYILGHFGSRELEEALTKAKQRAADAEETQKRESDECAQRERAAKTSRQLLLTREELLKAVVELSSNNYGLTSQHLAQARSWLKSAEKGLKPADGKRAREIFDRIGDAQTLAMRLDPLARNHIERILVEMQRLPGAR